ncbi:TPA: patatin-like phospholipase family protein [Burkholderia cenocepacia]|nr:patatin-like phospholipase family protein [Burkholderia cenocepacia]HDV6325025.1 patatin-like phospholipase family protein [Burkholderia cenocepacia]HDV6353094.1 patatin-like phospholipase family protein [Burkholderia cenocepacia]
MVPALLCALLVASCARLSTTNELARDKGLSGMTLEEVRADANKTMKPLRRRPIVAIVLGGGGLRGYAHIGVLQALGEIGFDPDIVVGTSIGAIVGAPYAAGASPGELWTSAEDTRVYSLADLTAAGTGFVKGEALARWVDSLVAGEPIERFPKRFAAVASDIERSIPVILTQGDAGEAARASASIPGVFVPMRYRDGMLVDGGVTSVVPVRVARAMGADIVVAVDIYCHSPRYPTTSIMSMVLRTTQVQSCLIAQNELAEADVLIAPAVSPAGAQDAAGRERARQAGYDAAKSAAPQLEALLRRRQQVLRSAPDAPISNATLR